MAKKKRVVESKTFKSKSGRTYRINADGTKEEITSGASKKKVTKKKVAKKMSKKKVMKKKVTKKAAKKKVTKKATKKKVTSKAMVSKTKVVGKKEKTKKAGVFTSGGKKFRRNADGSIEKISDRIKGSKKYAVVKSGASKKKVKSASGGKQKLLEGPKKTSTGTRKRGMSVKGAVKKHGASGVRVGRARALRLLKNAGIFGVAVPAAGLAMGKLLEMISGQKKKRVAEGKRLAGGGKSKKSDNTAKGAKMGKTKTPAAAINDSGRKVIKKRATGGRKLPPKIKKPMPPARRPRASRGVLKSAIKEYRNLHRDRYRALAGGRKSYSAWWAQYGAKIQKRGAGIQKQLSSREWRKLDKGIESMNPDPGGRSRKARSVKVRGKRKNR